MAAELVKNFVGRLVPTEVNGKKEVPYLGNGKYRPEGHRYGPPIVCGEDYPADGNKVVPSLKEALQAAGLRDGMVVSTHHHLRNGDLVANEIFRIASEMGIKDLVWFPSASFPCHAEIIKYMEDGTVHHIEGSMNGPLGKYCSEGNMRGTAILRSHGGRYQAIEDGEVIIDIAVIAAPTSDPFGNCNGVNGPSACGGLGFALPDSLYAHKSIVVTDNLVPFPCIPMQLLGNYIDYVVVVDKIGVPEEIVSGTLQITKSPDRLLLAELTAHFCDAAGLIYDGFCFQAGAGGTSLAISNFFHQLLKKRGWKARWAIGGSTEYSVKMLAEGQLEYLLDGQTFDLSAIKSMRDNINHPDISVFHIYDYHSKGFNSTMIDVMVLGATEVDVNFNGNVVSHSDGYLLHGIGGWQNCLFSKCTILPIPLFRNRMPVILDEVTTLVGPGSMVDVIVTERGIAINPLRKDLIEKTKNSGLPFKTILQLQAEAEAICGKPAKPELDEDIVAVIKWVDGTLIDSVRKVKTK
ncbi:MAG: citrate lyase subunit alpha [Candidatus Cloacimonetes bacterium]|nr:citrate lyase subunit alpha [Candidatus Cloacimonadota bacterium]